LVGEEENMAAIDDERLWFLRGILAALASSGQVVHYDEIRRLTRLSQEQVGEFLGAARAAQRPGDPDFCAIVVNEGGWPGQGFGPLDEWPAQLRDAHNYWRARRELDNADFRKAWGHLPSLPGLPKER
jgi:hypothetical protein